MADFAKALLTQLDSLKTEPEIIEYAEELKSLKSYSNLNEEDYQYALDKAITTLNVSFGKSISVESNQKLVPWFESYYKDLGVTRWDRYIDYLQFQKGFPPAVLNGMKENLFKLTDLLGDPNGENFRRKGLVVGDVQSGKTANYVGLMNLATDAKYKLIIVLTGTTNTLREQTQIRIEDGLGKKYRTQKGVTSIKNIEYDSFEPPMYFTSQENDFNKNFSRNINFSLEQTNVPIVIVTKKNSNALKNIYSWLDDYSRKQNHDHIDSSLLLIDDEADFASVNTKKEEDSPTAINSRIREILELFTKSSYIGFTATPFANIFINPENDHDMYGQTLFPSDYIYVLGESKEYLGVQQIFSKEADHENMLVTLNSDDIEETYLPLKHKKEHPFENLSPSMRDAVDLFFIANVIRDLREDYSTHRSMMINISRFSDMHMKIKDVVHRHVLKVQKEIRLYSKLPFKEALEREAILSLKKSFEKHYANLEDNYSFEEILRNMNDSIYRIQVAVINKDNKDVNYLLNEKEGERVIVIGGFALSRGLTLEGLMISYYRRNSVMYDSLLQMGRWFGYRPNYEDLVKIFMSNNVISDFEFIAMATKELKEDLEMNSKRGLTPRQFGIKVRSGQAGLIITARNKMRTGAKITSSVNFSKDIVETLAISTKEKESNLKNIKAIKEIIETNKHLISGNSHPEREDVLPGLVNVDKMHITQFLKDFTPSLGSKFDSSLIIKWLDANELPEIDKWDVAFLKGSGKSEFDFGYGICGPTNVRTMIKAKDMDGIYKTKNSRLGSPTDGRFGLNQEQLEIVRGLNKNKDTIPQKNYFDSRVNRKPIMIIYSVEPRDSDSNILFDRFVPMVSLGIPELGSRKSRYVNYTVNTIYKDAEEIEVDDD